MDRDHPKGTAERATGAIKDKAGKVTDDDKNLAPRKAVAATGKKFTGFGLVALTNRIKKIKKSRRQA